MNKLQGEGSPHDVGGSSRFLSRSQSAPLGSATVPVCQNCATSITPLWRRDESGATLCNACGLFLKLHGCARPTSLKTDTIKSRNRMKHATHVKSKTMVVEGKHSVTSATSLQPATGQPAMPSPTLTEQDTELSSQQTQVTEEPLSPQGNENLYSQLPILPAGTAPLQNSFNAQNAFCAHSVLTIDSLLQANAALRTRVSELELVNDLFKSRVSELEMNEAQMRRQDVNLNDLDRQLRLREAELERREAYLHLLMQKIHQQAEHNNYHKRKKIRVSELLEETNSFLIDTLPLKNGPKKVNLEHPILSGI